MIVTFFYVFTHKLNLRNPNKNIALANLSIYYTWKTLNLHITTAGRILDIRGIDAFYGKFSEKGHFVSVSWTEANKHFVCLHPINRCHFYPFLIKIFFSKLRALD